MFKAVIFDMDGVLVDSEPVITAAAIAGLREYGVEAVPGDFLPFVGCGEDRFVGGVAEKYGLTYEPAMKHRVYQIYLELVDARIKVFPGIHQLLADLDRAGFKMALASSADRIKVDANLRAAGIRQNVFSALVSGEDVAHKKPAPDIYLKAAGEIGIRPEHCIVIEDAVNGVQAARTAGMACIAVTTSFSRDDLEAAGAGRIADSVSEIMAIIQKLILPA